MPYWIHIIMCEGICDEIHILEILKNFRIEKDIQYAIIFDRD